MARTLVAAFAALQLLVPERIVSAGERLAFENPGECALRAWTLPVARLKALGFLFVALRCGGTWRRFRHLLALIGLPAALAPRSYLRFGLTLAYEDPECCAVRSWALPVTRALGALYLLIALASGRAGGDAA
jgi:hypothetical protein